MEALQRINAEHAAEKSDSQNADSGNQAAASDEVMKDAEEGANEAEASSAVFNGFGSEDIAGDKHM